MPLPHTIHDSGKPHNAVPTALLPQPFPGAETNCRTLPDRIGASIPSRKSARLQVVPILPKDNYRGYVRSLSDKDLCKAHETVTADLAVNIASTTSHAAHSAASGGLTSPIGMLFGGMSGRKGYVNSRKLSVLKEETNRRGLDPEFGARGIVKVVFGDLMAGAELAKH